MNKLFKSLILVIVFMFVFAGFSFANSYLTSIRLQAPASQTNKDTFSITFVALDTNPSQPVSVQCYKKGPADGGFSAFGSLINLSNGGNTDNCSVTSNEVNQGNGTYQFYASVITGSTTPQSQTVSVDYNKSGPGTPENYKKEKINACTYKITFSTSHDSGKTVKVRLYRSTEATFGVDAAHQVNEVNIGSATDGNMTNDVSPNCDDNYYALRAFDVYGNGSGVIGDSSTTVINPTTSQIQGAIPVDGGDSGVAGASDEKSATKKETSKEVLGEEVVNLDSDKSTEAQNPISNATTWVMTHKKISLTVLAFIIIGGYLVFRYRKNKTT